MLTINSPQNGTGKAEESRSKAVLHQMRNVTAEQVTTTAFSASGGAGLGAAIAGMAIGGLTLPVVGSVAGAIVGGVLGYLLGAPSSVVDETKEPKKNTTQEK